MLNRLNERTNEHLHEHVQAMNTAIDAAHREMIAYQQEPHLSPARREHFLKFLLELEAVDQLAREYPVAHSNRVRRGKGIA